MVFHLLGRSLSVPLSFPFNPRFSTSPGGRAREHSERSFESYPSHPVFQIQSAVVVLGNYNSQHRLRQRRRRRLSKRHGGGRVGGVSCALIGQVQPLRKTRAATGAWSPGSRRLVGAAEAAWISASWRETIRAAVA